MLARITFSSCNYCYYRNYVDFVLFHAIAYNTNSLLSHIHYKT